MIRKLFALLALSTLSFYCFAQTSSWPVQQTKNGSTLITYQPQIDSWKDYQTIEFRQAFTLTPPGGQEEVGIIHAHAQTEVNKSMNLVMVHNLDVWDIRFPNIDSESSVEYLQKVKSFLPDTTFLELGLVVACVPKDTVTNTVQLQNLPPVIYVSYTPAILLQLDGEAMSTDIPDTKLSYTFNANFPLFFDKKKSNYYLFDGKEWITSVKFDGDWKIASELPKDMNELINDSTWASLKGIIPPPKTNNTSAPEVFYDTELAELILFDGRPVYSKIGDLDLVYASNTESDVFLDKRTDTFYYLLAGRWFSCTSLNGPWAYATDKLPEDFQKIPYDSPAAHVLVSVPGTEEAKDAVLLAQVPTTITVNPKTAPDQVHINYNGEPKFEPIEGTDMYYATNTPDKIILCGDLYYLCFQAVWFVSTKPNGPWETATTIPNEIYTIPPSSPVYNVTYVEQTTTSSGEVESTYTSGYTGGYVSESSTTVVVVSGTGYYYPPVYYYPPYGYPYYYAYPATYGYAAYYYNPYNPYPTSYHTSYTSTGAYARSATAYGPYGSATVAQSYNPNTGTYGRGASTTTTYGTRSAAQAYNPYTGTYARGASASGEYGSKGAAQAYNPYTGSSAQTRQSSTPEAQWGSTTVTNRQGESATTAHATTQYGTTGAVKTTSGDVYAGKDGNVYQKTDDGWSQVNGAQPNAKNPPSQTQAAQQQTAQSKSSQAQQSSQSQASQNQASQTRSNQSQGTSGSTRSASGSQHSSASQSRSSGYSSSYSHSQDLNQQHQSRQRSSYHSQQYSRSSYGGGYGGSRSYGGRGGGRRR